MSSRHLIDPEIRAAVESFPGFGLADETYLDVRANYHAMVEAYGIGSGPEGVSVVEHIVPGSTGHPDVRVLMITPEGVSAPLPCLLEIHGGGHVIGSADLGIAKCADLARTLKAVIVSVDYRLAPETKFPGSIEDCYAALAWIHERASQFGIDPGRVAVMGESAGGTLAAGLALLARDRGRFPICHLHLIFPMLDDRICVSEDIHPFAGEFVWTRADNLFGWTAMLDVPPGSPDVSPYAAPARATDLAGLPPTFISCGALDLYLEEDMDFARRLIRAGVPVELHVYPGAPHGYALGTPSRLLDAALQNDRRALARALAPREPLAPNGL